MPRTSGGQIETGSGPVPALFGRAGPARVYDGLKGSVPCASICIPAMSSFNCDSLAARLIHAGTFHRHVPFSGAGVVHMLMVTAPLTIASFPTALYTGPAQVTHSTRLPRRRGGREDLHKADRAPHMHAHGRRARTWFKRPTNLRCTPAEVQRRCAGASRQAGIKAPRPLVQKGLRPRSTT